MMTPDDMVATFWQHLKKLVLEIFPEKAITVSDKDQPFFTEELRLLRRRRQREYQKRGRSDKYLELKERFEETLKNEARKYKEKVIQRVKDGDIKSSYKLLRNLGDGPQDKMKKRELKIPKFIDNNMSDQECADFLADHFSKISQNLEPIDVNDFHPELKNSILKGINCDSKVFLNEYEVYEKLSKMKKPNSVVPGDIPPVIMREFAPELAFPVMQIFNKITETCDFPSTWKIEHQIVIQKKSNPQSEEELRNLSKTDFLAKTYLGLVIPLC